MKASIKQEKRPNVVAFESRSRSGGKLPERYLIKEAGAERVLTCLETPNLQVRIKAGWSVSASAAHKAPPGTIFLDGVAQCEPFMDHERHVYNLDHHEGCVRAFTLATCEQAMIMIKKGLDLQDREWKIYGNEPDLDTILAVWILLNSRRISAKDPIHQRILFALVRLEGVIDSLGLELKELSAFPADLMHKTMRIIEHLRSDEVQLKKEASWSKTDFLEYTISVLHKIDRILYTSSEFADFKGVDELARTELTNNRIAAVVESDLGIYELEPHLNKLYGNRLGWVALRTGSHTYTLRQMDLFMPFSLEDVYPWLNFADPAVRNHNSANKWGGSSDIGGSPRGTGTRLSPQEIADACREVVANRSAITQAKQFFKTVLQIVGIVILAELFRLNWHPAQWIDTPLIQSFFSIRETSLFLAMLTLTLLAIVGYARRRPWQYGLMPPVGKIWLIPLPLGILFGLAGGVIILPGADFALNPASAYLTELLFLPLTLELLFRGLAHGLLSQSAAIQDSQSRWFLSWPNFGSSVCYAFFLIAYLVYHASDLKAMLQSWILAKYFISALGFALAAGAMREKSQSILSSYFMHAVAVAVIVFIYDPI